MKKVISLGEILLRLSPLGHRTLQNIEQLGGCFGGSEYNVVVNLAHLGHDVGLITALPENDLGFSAHQALRANGIKDTALQFSGQRLGLYYYQKGISFRSSKVIYDREYSSFATASLEDFDFEDLFESYDWFHVSGITLALNENLYQITLKALKIAKEKGMTISFDLNYRANLWKSFQEAREKLSPLVQFADICFGFEPLSLLDEKGDDVKDQMDLSLPYQMESLLPVLRKICESYQLQSLAFTQRRLFPNNTYQLKAFLYENGELYETHTDTVAIVDRVGTGDAFTAGIIAGYLENRTPLEMLNRAFALFKYKHTLLGDVNSIRKEELDDLMKQELGEIKR